MILVERLVGLEILRFVERFVGLEILRFVERLTFRQINTLNKLILRVGWLGLLRG